MPVIVTLSTLPGKLTRDDRGTSMTIELTGRSIATQTLTAISTVPDIKAAVARFGTKVRTEHPEVSFYVLVRLAQGCRKPNGYDAASDGNGLGQQDFLHTTDTRTRPAESAAAPAAPAPLAA